MSTRPLLTVAPTQNILPHELLRYLSEYGAIICTICKYAIQPSAVSRHLKDIHRIHRSRRRPFMEYVDKLDLKSPGEVISSYIINFPVEILPVQDGLACNMCQYRCISEKRMKGHMVSAHCRPGQASLGWCFAPLQTFFRGNLIHYFTAPPSHISPAKPEQLLTSMSSTNSEHLSAGPRTLVHRHTAQGDPRGSQVVSGSGSSPSSLTNKYSDTAVSDRQCRLEPLLPLQLKPGLDGTDELLFQEYITSTCRSIADAETRYLWRVTVPQIAYHQPFLLHGLLAVSALHLAYQHPTDLQHVVRASYHQNFAMPRFREAISNPNRDNCDAILAFSHLLVIYSWAAEKQDERLFFVEEEDPNLMPAWLFFIRTGCSMLCDVWEDIESGPLGYLAISWDIPIIVLGDNKTPLVDYLKSIIPLPESDDAWSPDICRAYCEAATELGLAFRCAHALGESFTTWDALRVWPLRVGMDYIELLHKHHPSALILLAHYCPLLQRLESRWYLEGRAKRLLSAVTCFLDRKWHCYIQWPLAEVGQPLAHGIFSRFVLSSSTEA